MRVRRTNEQSKAELRRRVIQETSLSFALLGRAVVASMFSMHIPLIGICLGSSLWILSWMLFCISCALLHHHVLRSLALFLPTTVNHCFQDFMSASHPGTLQAARVFLPWCIAHFSWGDFWGGFLTHVPPPASNVLYQLTCTCWENKHFQQSIRHTTRASLCSSPSGRDTTTSIMSFRTTTSTASNGITMIPPSG